MTGDALEGLTGHISPAFWGRTIARQLGRIEADQALVLAEFAASRAYRERAVELHRDVMADAHFLVVAIRMLLRFQDQLIELTGDPRAMDAADEFRRLVPHARDLRNILEHMDEYAIGLGSLQGKGEVDPDHRRPSLLFQSSSDPRGEVSLIFGDRRIPLKATARISVELADLLHHTWNEHIGRRSAYSARRRRS